MNKRLTTDMADANGLKKSYKSYRIFQHQENGCRFLQRAMHNGQYWAFKEQVWIVLDVSLFFSNQHELHVLCFDLLTICIRCTFAFLHVL